MMFWFGMIPKFLIIGFLILSFHGCKKQGCTDPSASNYNSSANKNDGTCEFKGCTNSQALNYNPDALEDDSSCVFYGSASVFTNKSVGNGKYVDVFLNSEYAGKIQVNCLDSFVDCNNTVCSGLQLFDLEPGVFTLSGLYIHQTGSSDFDTLETISSRSITVPSGDCASTVL